MKLFELFKPQNKSFQWDKHPDGNGNAIASFVVDNVVYQVAFEYSSYNKAVVIEFSAVQDSGFGDTGITGTGNAFAVFNHVIDIINRYQSIANPNAIMFSASEKSRIKLYNRLSVNMANKWNYKLTTNHSAAFGTTYRLEKQ